MGARARHLAPRRSSSVTVVTPPRRSAGRVIGAALLGVVMATVGTGIHRVNPPWGITLALLIVFSAAVLARAWARRSGVIALGVAVVLGVLAMGRLGPGGDVIIAAQPVGYAWLLASVVAVAAVGLLPRRWFSDQPVGRRSERVIGGP